MSEQWDFYLANVNDAIASIFVDLAIHPFTPDSMKPNLLWVWVDLKVARPDGLTRPEESSSLFQIEDSLNAVFTKRLSAEAVGRITTKGRREFYYYAPQNVTEKSLHDAAREAFKIMSDYQYVVGMKDDSDWTQYKEVLYPSPISMQSIQNRKILAEMRKHGDALEEERSIEHFVFFKTEAHRLAFLMEARELAFEQAQDGLTETAGAEYPYTAKVQRKDIPDQEHIDEATSKLVDLATRNRGTYDGWETVIIRSMSFGRSSKRDKPSGPEAKEKK